jgi:hypothetical protein
MPFLLSSSVCGPRPCTCQLPTAPAAALVRLQCLAEELARPGPRLRLCCSSAAARCVLRLSVDLAFRLCTAVLVRWASGRRAELMSAAAELQAEARRALPPPRSRGARGRWELAWACRGCCRASALQPLLLRPLLVWRSAACRARRSLRHMRRIIHAVAGCCRRALRSRACGMVGVPNVSRPADGVAGRHPCILVRSCVAIPPYARRRGLKAAHVGGTTAARALRSGRGGGGRPAAMSCSRISRELLWRRDVQVQPHLGMHQPAPAPAPQQERSGLDSTWRPAAGGRRQLRPDRRR